MTTEFHNRIYLWNLNELEIWGYENKQYFEKNKIFHDDSRLQFP